MVENQKLINLVGLYIRTRREALGLSQKALGQLFSPPVTTQFISNVERGVTPLPPVHLPTVTQALKVTEVELVTLMEREYTAKLSGRLSSVLLKSDGSPSDAGSVAVPHEISDESPRTLTIRSSDFGFFESLYKAYRQSDGRTRQTFQKICDSLFQPAASQKKN